MANEGCIMEHSVPLENVQNNSIEITAELNSLKDRQELLLSD
jgi:hypothetical protein